MMNNAVFRKSMENVRKDKDVKLIKADARRNHLVPHPKYYTNNVFQNVY